MSGRHPPDDSAWADALRAVTEVAAVEDALALALRRLAPLTGARAAAFADLGGQRVRASWEIPSAEVLPLLARELLDDGTASAPAADALRTTELELPDQGTATVTLVPAQSADGAAALLLLYPDGVAPGAGSCARAEGLAALGGILLDREFFAEENRRAQQARDHFLVAIHHELRTPATAVMLEAGIVQSGILGTPPGRLRDALGRLETQVTELVRVIRRVLDLARLEAGVDPAREDLVDPRQAVIEVVRRADPSARRKNIVLAVFVPRTLPLLQTDGERFRRILLYLLANALKYTDAGRVEVRVERVTRQLGAHRREHLLRVRVADTGRGIPPDELDRVFEPFAQVEEGSRTDSTRRGVGLGLSLARKLARSLGGDVAVESEPGAGTVATFEVPYSHPRAE